MMEPGRVDGLLNIEGEIDDADQNVSNRCDDPGAAGRAENEEKLAVSGDDGGRHGGEWALAGADGVGRTLNESVDIGNTLLGGEVVHFIVEQEAQTLGSDARAEYVIEGRGHGNRVAIGIDDGIVRRVLRFTNGGGMRLGDALQFSKRRAF